MKKCVDLHDDLDPKLHACLADRRLAERLRDKYRLVDFDDRAKQRPELQMTIVIPHFVRVLSLTFFVALLGGSLRYLGKERFCTAYRFDHDGSGFDLKQLTDEVWEMWHTKQRKVCAVEDFN